MENKLIIDDYYLKLLYSGLAYSNYFRVLRNKKIIKTQIDSIIKNNDECLLTDSFINYLASRKSIIKDLNILINGSLSDKYNLLKDYYQNIIFDILNDKESIYRKLQDDNTKYMTIYISHLIKDINNYYAGNMIAYKKIIYITLAYCHINNCINKFIGILNNLENNNGYIFEVLELNDINETNNEYFTTRIINAIENKKELIIK